MECCLPIDLGRLEGVASLTVLFREDLGHNPLLLVSDVIYSCSYTFFLFNLFIIFFYLEVLAG